jgi:hypothetical protein
MKVGPNAMDANQQLPRPYDENLWLIDVSKLGLWPLIAGSGLLLIPVLVRMHEPSFALAPALTSPFYLLMFIFATAGVVQLIRMHPQKGRHVFQFSLAQMFWLVTLASMIVSAACFVHGRGSLRYSFQLHLAEFDRLADETLRRGYPAYMGNHMQIGPFEVHRIGIRDKDAVFYLNDSDGEPSNYALARLPSYKGNEKTPERIGNAYWRATRLCDDWFAMRPTGYRPGFGQYITFPHKLD